MEKTGELQTSSADRYFGGLSMNLFLNKCFCFPSQFKLETNTYSIYQFTRSSVVKIIRIVDSGFVNSGFVDFFTKLYLYR